MATKTTVIIYDDLDGTPGASRVSFAYRGTSYEIDLSEQHQAELGAALGPFIVAARRIGRGSERADGTATTRLARGQNLAAVRAWAREHGLEVSDRGRVPIEVQKAYDAAH